MLMPDTAGNPFRRFWDLGYHRLVPIIPPDAPISEKSSIATRMRAGDDSRGKTPGVKGADGKWRGISLVAMESQEGDLEVWNDMGAGVGVKLGDGLVALDIDTTDQKAAQELYTLAGEILGPAHVRFGRKPKCLMLYEAPKDTGYKQVRFATPTEPWHDDKKARGGARVELLAEARQFVAHGIHPGTGQPYAWPGGVPRREQLTRVSAQQIDAFMARAAERLGGDVMHRAERADTPDQEALRAPDWDTLRSAVEAVPNTSALFPSRDDYVKMAYAVAASAPDGYELEARDLYLDWCERWEEGENDPEVALKDWGRAKPPFRTGFGFIQANAPGLFFQPVEGAAQDEADAAIDMFKANEEASRPRLYDLKSLEDIEAMEPPEFLIGRHIPEEGFGILYGAPGSKKSFFALDMALHLAYGLPDWHGDEILQREGRGGVLYIAGEGGPGFKHRVAAWRKGRLLPAGKSPDIRFLFEQVNFMRPEDIHRLRDTVKHHHPEPLSLITVDTVSRAIPGADENLQKDMTIFVAACEALQRATGAFVLGIHHTSRQGNMRGSTVFEGQADVILSTEDTKRNGIVRLHCNKLKDGGSDGWHDAYRMEEVTLGEKASSLVPRRMEAGEEVEASRLETAVQERALDAMRRAWDVKAPWSNAKQSKRRFAPTLLAEITGLDETEARGILDLWEQQGIVAVEMCDANSKMRGYRVVGKIDPEGPVEGGIFD